MGELVREKSGGIGQKLFERDDFGSGNNWR